MNQKTGICIVFLLAVLLVFGIWQQQRIGEGTEYTTEAPEPTEETVVTSAADSSEEPWRYIVRLCDGRLVVYRSDGVSVYMETGIRSEALSSTLLLEAQSGIGFSTQEQLFDFLESYAS